MRQLRTLYVQLRVRERAEVAGVIPVEVRRHHLLDVRRIDAEAAEAVRRATQELVAAGFAGALVGARVDDDRAGWRDGGPHEEVHRHRRVVGIVRRDPHEVLDSAPMRARGVPDGVELIHIVAHRWSPPGPWVSPRSIHTLLVWRYSRMASTPLSRPRPEALQPPNGDCGAV